METNNLNLCELLKGHEGETFYSSAYGSVVLIRVTDSSFPIVMKSNISFGCFFTSEGKMYNNDSECVLFPSKEQRDWNKWVEEQNHKVPKTFDEIPLAERDYFIRNIPNFELSKIQKSALALLKIHQLIEIGYGGNVTNEEWDYTNWKYKIYVSEYNEIKVCSISYKFPILFHTKEQAKEFLSHTENMQLIKDFYMI